MGTAVQMYGHVTGMVNRPLSINLGQQTSNKNGWAQRRPLYGRWHCTGMYSHILPLYTHLSCIIAPLQPPAIAATSGACMRMPHLPLLDVLPSFRPSRPSSWPSTTTLVLDYSGGDPLGGLWGCHPIRISLSQMICCPSCRTRFHLFLCPHHRP